MASELRLSAAHFIYAITLSASATALFGAWGLPVAGFVALVWWQILSGAQRESQSWARQSAEVQSERAGKLTLELAAVLVVFILLLGLFLPVVDDSDPMRHAEISMQVVSQAISDYEQQCGRELQSVIRDSSGRPMHSWRALILPQLGEHQLAAAYRLDEPWNSPNNLRLADARPWHFQIYDSRGAADSGQTSLHLLRVDSQPTVVEHEQADCNWLEPTELSLSDWHALNRLPDVDQGFWARGFFMSTYRGRLAVSKPKTFEIHPGNELTEQLVDAGRQADSATWTRKRIGEPIRHYHLDHALQLATFLLVALYPIRWLKRIQSPDTDQN